MQALAGMVGARIEFCCAFCSASLAAAERQRLPAPADRCPAPLERRAVQPGSQGLGHMHAACRSASSGLGGWEGHLGCSLKVPGAGLGAGASKESVQRASAQRLPGAERVAKSVTTLSSSTGTFRPMIVPSLVVLCRRRRQVAVGVAHSSPRPTALQRAPIAHSLQR